MTHPFTRLPRRNHGIVLAVVAMHALLLLAWPNPSRPLLSPEPVILASVLLPESPRVEPAPPAPPAPRRQSPPPSPTPRTTAPMPTPSAVAPTPGPAPVTDPPPAVTASTGVSSSRSSDAPAPTAPPPPPVVELPSANADYLNNPKPAYPPLSRRLREQGKVVVRAFIDTDGTATQAEIHTSSGHERLDQAARQTVLRWRYVPGKRAGVAQGMWFHIPINFVLE